MTSKTCIIVLASERHNPIHVARTVMMAEKAVQGLGVDVKIAVDINEVPRDCKGMAILLATGGTENLLLDVAEAHKGPLLAAGIPLANSVSSLAEAAPLLRDRAHILPLPGIGGEGVEALREAVAGLKAASEVWGSRLLLIGEPSPWLIHDPKPLLDKLNVRVEVLDPGEFAEIARKSRPWTDPADELARAEDAEYGEGEPERSLKVAGAVFNVAKARGAGMVSPACIRFLEATGANACLAHALQHRGGVIVGCEGDIVATLSLALATHAWGQPAWQANLAGAWRDKALLAHCSAPLSMASRFRLRRHFITGGSVTVEAALNLDRVTLLRLDPRGREALVMEVRVLDPYPRMEMQCETQLLVEAPGIDLVRRGTGNHYAVAGGGLGPRLRAAVESMGLPVVGF